MKTEGKPQCLCRRCFVRLKCHCAEKFRGDTHAMVYCRKCAPFTAPPLYQGCGCVGCVAERKDRASAKGSQ